MKEFELEPGEQVVQELRRHWILFVLELLPYAILAIIPFALPNLVTLVPPLASFAGYLNTSDPLMRVALGIWLLLTWTAAWSSFTRYFLNLWVLTNQRIVEIKQPSYFNREVSSMFLNRVQDVTSDVRGILSSVFDIGTIMVQSAGAENEFQMRGIPHPDVMRDVLLKYVSTKPEAPGV
jgi:hypothetical protein